MQTRSKGKGEVYRASRDDLISVIRGADELEDAQQSGAQNRIATAGSKEQEILSRESSSDQLPINAEGAEFMAQDEINLIEWFGGNWAAILTPLHHQV